MADLSSSAFALLADAEQKVKNGKKKDAAYLYLGAGRTFCDARMFPEAAKAYSECAGQHIDINNFFSAAFLFSEAGLVVRDEDPNTAILAFNRAIDIFTEYERYYFAGRRCDDLAGVYEKLIENDKAIEYRFKAAQYYAKASLPCNSLKMREQMAKINCELGQFQNAQDIYEEAAKAYSADPMMEHRAKRSYLKAALSGMCIDKKNATAALDRYTKDCPQFEKTKEYRFSKELLTAMEDQKVDNLLLAHKHDIYLNDPGVQCLLLKVQN